VDTPGGNGARRASIVYVGGSSLISMEWEKR
jgi:hypothetical protein